MRAKGLGYLLGIRLDTPDEVGVGLAQGRHKRVQGLLLREEREREREREREKRKKGERRKQEGER